jgi:hypothetical protein
MLSGPGPYLSTFAVESRGYVLRDSDRSNILPLSSNPEENRPEEPRVESTPIRESRSESKLSASDRRAQPLENGWKNALIPLSLSDTGAAVAGIKLSTGTRRVQIRSGHGHGHVGILFLRDSIAFSRRQRAV